MFVPNAMGCLSRHFKGPKPLTRSKMQSSFAVPPQKDSRRRRYGIQYFVVFHDFGEKRAVGVRDKTPN